MKPPAKGSVGARMMRATLAAAVRTPRPVARRVFGQPPRNDRGAPLDMQTHILLSVLEASGAPNLYDVGVEEARLITRRADHLFGLPERPMHAVDELVIDGSGGELAARLYRPRPGRLPACVYYHGGGFTIGSLDSHDTLCRALAERADCVVVSVDYRLAPEHPFPAAVDDGIAAFEWVRRHADELGVDPERLAVGGDSAGGNLAAVVCQECVRRGEPGPSHQLLIYPKTDLRPDRYPSRELFAEGFYLTGELTDWFCDTYLAGHERIEDPRISPMTFDALDELPPAFVITAGFDPLRDEGEAYARALADAGVPVVRRCRDQLVHGFVTMGGLIDAAARAVDDLAGEFGRLLRGEEALGRVRKC